VGSEYTLVTIAAVVIGGTSILGGEGAVWRSVMGVFLLTMIGNGFNLLNINPIYQQIVEGGIIVLAVAIDSLARRKST
jgi:ribose transport system permease protein